MTDVFITEVGGAGRWQQASVTFKFVHAFFGGDPMHVSSVVLQRYNRKGILVGSQTQNAIYKPVSSNWAFELPDLEGVPYPGKATRPIAIFRRMGSGGYGYEFLMPSDPPYAAVAALLAQKSKEPKGRLRRAIVALSELNTAWPSAPVVLAH